VIGVLGNDCDLDGELDPATLAVLVQPGATACSSTTRAARWNTCRIAAGAVDHFIYQVCDTGTPPRHVQRRCAGDGQQGQ
jgi:hypothetical protein